MQVFVSMKGETLEQKIQCVKSVGWGMNTNLQAAFEHVLETALDHEVPSEEMPKALIVVSDMEIDACVDENWMFYDHSHLCHHIVIFFLLPVPGQNSLYEQLVRGIRDRPQGAHPQK